MQPFVDQRNAPEVRVSDDPHDARDDVAAPAQKLIALLDRIEDFTTQQFRRLEMMIDLLENSSGEDDSLRETQVERWRLQWEEERSAEQRRMQQEGQLLIRAWKEIEDEQRRLLGMRESLTAQHAISCESVKQDQRSAETINDAEEMALSQFQKLRRDIQRHARRGRSA